MGSKKESKSVPRIILGIIFLVLAIGWLTNKVIDNQSISLFDWGYSGIFALNGLIHVIEGLGFSITKTKWNK